MGKQVRFHNYPADVSALDQFVVENQAMIIRGTAPTANPVSVATLLPEGDAPSDLLIVRSTDLTNLHWRHVPTRGIWAVDSNCSPVIEYAPGHTPDGEPKFLSTRGHGRMWFQTSHWVEDRLVQADPDFVAWAGRIFGRIKKRWVLIDRDYYYSPAAAELRSAAISLEANQDA